MRGRRAAGRRQRRASRRRRSRTCTSRMENDSTVIPALNKIDLPSAEPERARRRARRLVGCDPADVMSRPRRPASGCGDMLDRDRPGRPAPVGDPDAPTARAHLRLRLRLLPRRRHLRPGRRRQAHPPRPDQDDVDRRDARDARGWRDQARAGQGSGPGRRRGGLPHHGREGRAPVARRRHRHQPAPRRHRSRSAATAPATRWSSPASTRSTATTTRPCATPSSDSSSTTPP